MRAGPGQTVAGRYQVTGRPEPSLALGERCFAVDARTGAQVLLEALELPEVLAPDLYGTDAPDAGRWLDPAGILAEVTAAIAACPEHPRLQQSFHAVAEDGVVWTAVERPTAVGLPQTPAEGPWSPYRVAELAADLAGALRAVHTAGRAHGHVLPESVLVCEDGAALLGGHPLGVAQEALARTLGGTDGRRWVEARVGLVGPRAERWAPELLVPGGSTAAAAPADCWALGVLLYRLLTWRGPFPEQNPTVLFAALRSGRPADTEGCGPLRPLLDRLLVADPAARATAEEAQQWLAELLATAPEPYGVEEAESALPVLRPAWPLAVRRLTARQVVASEHARHARTRPSALLPVLLVGGVLTAMVLALVAVVVLAG